MLYWIDSDFCISSYIALIHIYIVVIMKIMLHTVIDHDAEAPAAEPKSSIPADHNATEMCRIIPTSSMCS